MPILLDPTVVLAPELRFILDLGVAGPEQTAVTLGIRRRVYGDLAGEPARGSAEPLPPSSEGSADGSTGQGGA